MFYSNNGLKYHKEKTKCEETESSSMEHSRTQSTGKFYIFRKYMYVVAIG